VHWKRPDQSLLLQPEPKGSATAQRAPPQPSATAPSSPGARPVRRRRAMPRAALHDLKAAAGVRRAPTRPQPGPGEELRFSSAATPRGGLPGRRGLPTRADPTGWWRSSASPRCSASTSASVRSLVVSVRSLARLSSPARRSTAAACRSRSSWSETATLARSSREPVGPECRGGGPGHLRHPRGVFDVGRARPAARAAGFFGDFVEKIRPSIPDQRTLRS